MLWVMAVVQKVELVGGESWLEHGSVALAAIVAASLAALVAVLNRRAELKHDRAMRNRDHMRDIVDLSYGEINRGVKEVSELMGVVQGAEIWREEVETSSDEAETQQKIDQRLEAARSKTYSTTLDLLTANARLQMRLGQDHPIVTTHENVRDAIDAYYNRAPYSVNSNRGQAEREIDDQFRDAAANAYKGFREACFTWLNE